MNQNIIMMKDRIIGFLRAENKTSAQFAEEIGVQPSGISHILSGRNNPSLDFVLKMLEKYKFLSTEWLLFGTGNMYKEQTLQDLFNQHSLDKNITGIDEPDQLASVKAVVRETKTESPGGITSPEVEKIVWFYNNNSFREYYPEKE